MPSFTLLFRGAAVGMLEGQRAGEDLGGNLSPVPGFELLRAAIGDASHALTKSGFLPPAHALAGGVPPAGENAAQDAFAVAQALCNELELRDSRGQLIPTDWINVFGGRTADDPVSVLARLALAASTVGARGQQPIGGDAGAEPQAG